MAPIGADGLERLSERVVLPAGPAGQKLRRVLDAIDAVHRVGPVPVLPVRLSPSVPGLAHYGIAESESIEIEIQDPASSQELLLLHEIGHFTDHQVLGERGLFATGPRGSISAGSHGSRPEIVTLMDLMLTSRPVRALAYLSQHTTNSRTRRYAQYLMQPREMFARSYTQYVISRSDDRVLRRQLRDPREDLETWRIARWKTEEFRPIGTEFDRILSQRGWRIE